MPLSNISTKGQVTLPISLRRKLGMKPHDRVIIEADDKSIVIRRAPNFFDYKGCLSKAVPREKEIEGFLDAVAAHVLGKDE